MLFLVCRRRLLIREDRLDALHRSLPHVVSLRKILTRMGEEDVREMNTPVHETNTPVSALEQLADDSIEGNDE
jgi:hypothetical protein